MKTTWLASQRLKARLAQDKDNDMTPARQSVGSTTEGTRGDARLWYSLARAPAVSIEPGSWVFNLCVLCVLCGLVLPDLRADEFSQTSHYAVRMFSMGTLTLDTRTGDILIEGWDEPRLEVEAEKVVRAKSEVKAKPLYDRVRIELEGQDKAVRLRTIYPSRKLWRPFRDESRLSVNLRVKMPAEANVKLHCVDGDVRIMGITGHEVLLVNYGDVEIDIPDVYYLRSLDAHAWLGYVQTDLHSTGDQDSSGLHPRLSFWNSLGNQNIIVKVRMGGVWVYGY